MHKLVQRCTTALNEGTAEHGLCVAVYARVTLHKEDPLNRRCRRAIGNVGRKLGSGGKNKPEKIMPCRKNAMHHRSPELSDGKSNQAPFPVIITRENGFSVRPRSPGAIV
jgi:hypothetical protein